MSIYPRITGEDPASLEWHALKGAIAEVRRGKTTAIVVRTAFGLTVAERDEITALVNLITAGTLTMDEVDDVMLLANTHKIYVTAVDVKTRLGVT